MPRLFPVSVALVPDLWRIVPIVFVGLWAGLPPTSAAAVDKPNVIFILTDDQDPDTLGCFGAKVLTPTIDRLAREGARFTRAYSVSSVCTPSRYICLTGQYASRCQTGRFGTEYPPGTQSNVGFNVTITANTPNVARVLHDAGYATGFVGKWHTGTPPPRPCPADGELDDPQVAAALAENQRRIVEYIQQCGFDYAASVYRGNLADHKLEALNVHNMEWVTRGALDFIAQNQGKPFFLHICTTLQHSPPPAKSVPGDWRVTPAGLLSQPLDVQAPRDSLFQRVREAGFDKSTVHATWLDDAIAAVWKKVADLGLADNTLIVLFSDNGTRHGKGTCFEGGVNTPALMYWKGHIRSGVVCDQLVQNTDFVPTILDACGVTPPATMQIDGESLLPLVTGDSTQWRDMSLLEIGHARAVVTAGWKYIALRYSPQMQRAIQNGTLGHKPYHMDTSLNLQQNAEAFHPGYWDADQLYDLQRDPLEKDNLVGKPEYTAVVAEMRARLTTCLARHGRPFGEFTQ